MRRPFRPVGGSNGLRQRGSLTAEHRSHKAGGVGSSPTPAPTLPERVFDVQTFVAEPPRHPPQIEFVHCGTVHYVSLRPLPRGEPIDPGAVVMVCGGCPVPSLGLRLTCHLCHRPLEAREAGGRLLRSV